MFLCGTRLVMIITINWIFYIYDSSIIFHLCIINHTTIHFLGENKYHRTYIQNHSPQSNLTCIYIIMRSHSVVVFPPDSAKALEQNVCGEQHFVDIVVL